MFHQPNILQDRGHLAVSSDSALGPACSIKDHTVEAEKNPTMAELGDLLTGGSIKAKV